MNIPRWFLRQFCPKAGAFFSILTLFSFLSGASAEGDADSLRGPLPAGQRDLIQNLAQNHHLLEREVSLTESGYVARTTTTDAGLAKQLVSHVTYMKKRLGSGSMVRRWDPAFVELIQYHDQIEVTVEALPNGIAVVVQGKTPDAVLVAKNHARIVSGFVEKGSEAVQNQHQKALQPEK
jgi:hypothetical protein